MTFFFHLLVLSFVFLLSCSEDKGPSQGKIPATHEGSKSEEKVIPIIMSKKILPPDEQEEARKGAWVRSTEKPVGGTLVSPQNLLDENGTEMKKRIAQPVMFAAAGEKEEGTHAPLVEGNNLLPPPFVPSSKDYSGTKQEIFADGTLKVESHYLKGKKNGSYTVWYEKGGIHKKGWMKDDKWHGTYQEWWSEGSLRVKGNYIEGMQHGPWRFFDEEGDALPTLYFDKGEEVTRDLKMLRR